MTDPDPDTIVQPITWLAPQRPVEGGTVYVLPDGGETGGN